MNEEKKNRADVVTEAKAEFETLKSDSGDDEVVLCSHIYGLFHSGRASKTVAAQYLSELLPEYCEQGGIPAAGFRKLLPAYLVSAIEYVTDIDGASDFGTPFTDGYEDV